MNVVALLGRLTDNPDIRYSQDGKAIGRWTLAVQRKFKSADGEYKADFISCNCFGKTAEIAEKHLKKGTKIAVHGRIQTGSYTKDNKKIYTTDVIVDDFEFVEKKEDTQKESEVDLDEFMKVPEGLNEELPFN